MVVTPCLPSRTEEQAGTTAIVARIVRSARRQGQRSGEQIHEKSAAVAPKLSCNFRVMRNFLCFVTTVFAAALLLLTAPLNRRRHSL
jgi:hypothetical protein